MRIALRGLLAALAVSTLPFFGACDSTTEPVLGFDGTYLLAGVEPGIAMPYVTRQAWSGSALERTLRVQGVLELRGGRAVARYEDIATVWSNPGALRTTSLELTPSSPEFRVRSAADSVVLSGPDTLRGRLDGDTLRLGDGRGGAVQLWIRTGAVSPVGARYRCRSEDLDFWADVRRQLIRSEPDRISWWGCAEFDDLFGELRFVSADSVELGPYRGRYALDPAVLGWDATVRGPAGEFVLRGYMDDGGRVTRIALIWRGVELFAYGTARMERI